MGGGARDIDAAARAKGTLTRTGPGLDESDANDGVLCVARRRAGHFFVRLTPRLGPLWLSARALILVAMSSVSPETQAADLALLDELLAGKRRMLHSTRNKYLSLLALLIVLYVTLQLSYLRGNDAVYYPLLLVAVLLLLFFASGTFATKVRGAQTYFNRCNATLALFGLYFDASRGHGFHTFAPAAVPAPRGSRRRL